MNAALKRRIAALECLGVNDGWFVLECINQPTGMQLSELETAHLQGRMTLLFIESGNTLWKYGQPKPWEQCSVT